MFAGQEDDSVRTTFCYLRHSHKIDSRLVLNYYGAVLITHYLVLSLASIFENRNKLKEWKIKVDPINIRTMKFQSITNINIYNGYFEDKVKNNIAIVTVSSPK